MEYCNKLTGRRKEGRRNRQGDLEDLRDLTGSVHPASRRGALERALAVQTAYSTRPGRSAMREAMKDDEIEVAVQVNGKVKAVIMVPADIAKRGCDRCG